MIKKILTIAGSDSSGGAGIQADIKTITAHKMYAMSVITTLTAQNTLAVTSILDSPANFVAEQMDAVFTDIFPDAVKIGMVSNVDIVHVVAEKLKEYKPSHIVLDPVMISTSGFKLLSDDARNALISELMPLAELVTPNIPEAESICGFDIKDVSDMERAALAIHRSTGTAVLVKGGHLENISYGDMSTGVQDGHLGNTSHGSMSTDVKDGHPGNTSHGDTSTDVKDGHPGNSSCGNMSTDVQDGHQGNASYGGVSTNVQDDHPGNSSHEGMSTDVLCLERQCRYFTTKWILNPNTHGTGCTLSSAIACNLAAGKSLEESIMAAKEYLTDTLASMLDLGHGSGPLDHTCRI